MPPRKPPESPFRFRRNPSKKERERVHGDVLPLVSLSEKGEVRHYISLHESEIKIYDKIIGELVKYDDFLVRRLILNQMIEKMDLDISALSPDKVKDFVAVLRAHDEPFRVFQDLVRKGYAKVGRKRVNKSSGGRTFKTYANLPPSYEAEERFNEIVERLRRKLSVENKLSKNYETFADIVYLLNILILFHGLDLATVPHDKIDEFVDTLIEQDSLHDIKQFAGEKGYLAPELDKSSEVPEAGKDRSIVPEHWSESWVFERRAVLKEVDLKRVLLWQQLRDKFSKKYPNKENPFIDIEIDENDERSKNIYEKYRNGEKLDGVDLATPVKTKEEYKGISLAFFLHHYDIRSFAYTIARKLYEALSFMHREGILYQDGLHLGNILVFFDEKGELQIRLIDIGHFSFEVSNRDIEREKERIRRVFRILGEAVGKRRIFSPYIIRLNEQLDSYKKPE